MANWQIGELDQRISIIRQSTMSDGIGGRTSTPSIVATVWAKVIAQAGRERFHADRLNAESSYRFIIRHRSDVLESDRVQWNGALFNIRSVIREGGRPLYLEIVAERGVAQ